MKAKSQHHDMLSDMSTTLERTVEALKQLPAKQQSALVERFGEMVARARIDAHLERAEARGGETPADAFFAALKTRYGD